MILYNYNKIIIMLNNYYNLHTEFPHDQSALPGCFAPVLQFRVEHAQLSSPVLCGRKEAPFDAGGRMHKGDGCVADRMHTHVCTHTHTHTHVCTHTYAHTYAHTRMHTHDTRMHTHVRTHTYAHTRTHTHVRTHTYAHMCGMDVSS